MSARRVSPLSNVSAAQPTPQPAALDFNHLPNASTISNAADRREGGGRSEQALLGKGRGRGETLREQREQRQRASGKEEGWWWQP
eukprot:CAMPEP_0181339744 /NCGR_PEP_ID=MMETSP1101-20121128/29450_1 /TAXON_ID=46948 /ORGANISM="Rhodomonas abbreviata, Strain Caron Lab Isolate" /LENGTH=84 /DNA_ID=CAMNT_0023450795 /DNA_START=156 /DNA_END=406 /DNA_ORIENTATION=+